MFQLFKRNFKSKIVGVAHGRPDHITQDSNVQLNLNLPRRTEPDRNFSKGGRSFYFFDFDDNIAVLSTPSVIFHKVTGHELALSSKEFAEHSGHIGKLGMYRDYEIRAEGLNGSFRHFRDRDMKLLHRLLGKKQIFIDDFAHALGFPDFHWKGPSWRHFYHAVFNQRPVSLITARGHHPETIKDGIRLLVKEQHIPHEPNYLSLYPVNFPQVREQLSAGSTLTVAQLKQAAIRASVEEAIRIYGYSPHHRFGMSDDDPHNIRLILEEMTRLKRDHPQMSFFVFDTHKGQVVKHEVFEFHTEEHSLTRQDQLQLF
jgi:hypothetical protein